MGDVNARSCVVIGTFGSVTVILKYAASYAVQRGVGISRTRVVERARSDQNRDASRRRPASPPDDVVDLLLWLTRLVESALDDLNAIAELHGIFVPSLRIGFTGRELRKEVVLSGCRQPVCVSVPPVMPYLNGFAPGPVRPFKPYSAKRRPAASHP
jgi:hypothetical protein